MKEMDELRSKEMALHRHDIRTDAEELKFLLHRDFVEIGYSGNTYDYQSTIDALSAEPVPICKIWSQDYEYTYYSKDIVQVRYLAAQMNDNGALSRHAKRTSIWVKEMGRWKIKFHQATPISAFEKSCA